MTEEMKQQTSVRSFRVTDNVMTRFKEIQEEMGLTQDSALKMLVDGYEMEQAKNAIPDRETEIANFQAKAGELVTAFLHSLQLNQDAEARIRAEFALQLQTKDTAIADYQEQVKDLKVGAKELEEKLADLTAKAATVDDLRVKLVNEEVKAEQAEENFKKQIADKDSIISMLTVKLDDAEKRAGSVDGLIQERNRLTSELSVSQTTLKEREREFEMQTERAAYVAEKARNEAVEAVRSAKEQIIDELRQTLSDAKIEAEKRIHELDATRAAEIRELEAKISTLQIENARKDAELARLKGDTK